MAKVTYLLGAGASAGTIPTVKEIPEKLEELIRLLEDDKLFNPKDKDYTSKKKFQDILKKDIEWMYEHSAKHSSIDTFAKKLFLQNNHKDLSKLKKILSAYITHKQYSSKTNRRYDTFWASILNKSDNNSNYLPTPPDNIKIISWNYDFLLEQTFIEYLPEDIQYTIVTVKDYLNNVSSYSYNKPKINSSKYFEIIKLNGNCCNLYGSPSFHDPIREHYLYNNKNVKDILINDYIEEYNEYIKVEKHKMNGIHFAWEDAIVTNPIKENKGTFLDYVANSISHTEVLVIIGYSFPFFNRTIDSKILNSVSNDVIKSVYIQDLNPNNIATKFQATAPHIQANKIKQIPVNPSLSSDEFYLPPEL